MNAANCEIMRGDVSTRKIIGAGGILYFSSGSVGGWRGISCPVAVARATSEIRKVKLAVDTWPDLETKKDIIELKTAGYLGTG